MERVTAEEITTDSSEVTNQKRHKEINRTDNMMECIRILKNILLYIQTQTQKQHDDLLGLSPFFLLLLNSQLFWDC